MLSVRRRGFETSRSPSTATLGLAGRLGAVSGTSDGALSGGTAALGWSAPQGFGYRKPITFTTDGTNAFGSGPQFYFFEDWFNTTIGQDFTTSNTEFTDFGTRPQAQADNTATGKSMKVWLGSNNSQLGQAVVNFGGLHVTEVRVNAYRKIPTGTYYPGTTAVETLPTSVSCWKPEWIFLEDRFDQGGNGVGQTVDNDLIFHNNSGGPGYAIFDSNGLNIRSYTGGGNYPTFDPWASGRQAWGRWNRYMTWVKADAANPATGPGQSYTQFLGLDGFHELSFNPVPIASYNPTMQPIFAGLHGPLHYWTNLNIEGFMGNFTGTNYNPSRAETVVAAGTNSLARVEFSKFATYSAAPLEGLAELKQVSWNTSAVAALQTTGFINMTSPVWAHITRGDGTRYSLQVL